MFRIDISLVNVIKPKMDIEGKWLLLI